MMTTNLRASGSSADDESNSVMDVIITPTHQEWLTIKERCYNPNHPSYKDFGAIGATVCAEWLLSYSNFLNDMGAVPHQYATFFIERIDSTESYYKANCRWTVRQESNRRLHFQINPSGNFDLLAPSTDPKTPTTRYPTEGTFASPTTPATSTVELPPVTVHKATPRPPKNKCLIL